MRARPARSSLWRFRAVAWIALVLSFLVIGDTAGAGDATEAEGESAGGEAAGSSATATPVASREPEAPIDESLLRDPAALLRESRTAMEREDFGRADRLLEALGRRHSIVGDFAGLPRGRALRAAGRPAEAQTEVDRAISDFPTSPLRAELHALQGDLRREQGN